MPIICALRKAAHLDKRSATSGLSHSVEGIIARFIATVMNATGGEKPALTRTLPHGVCGYNLILRVRGSESAITPPHWIEHQTTNLGVWSSNLSGRANIIKDLRQLTM